MTVPLKVSGETADTLSMDRTGLTITTPTGETIARSYLLMIVRAGGNVQQFGYRDHDHARAVLGA